MNLFLLVIFKINFLYNDTLIPKDTVKFSYQDMLTFNYGRVQKTNKKTENLLKGRRAKSDLLGNEDDVHYYCIIYNKKGHKSKEGFWTLECFYGPYKEYYNNGKLKMEGDFMNPMKTNSNCLKVKLWKYYNKKGKIVKKEYYSNEGNLISIQKF